MSLAEPILAKESPSREASHMNGAEALVASAIRGGVEICFANPGTTELPLVQALDSVPGLRPAGLKSQAVRRFSPTRGRAQTSHGSGRTTGRLPTDRHNSA
jgi:hypothetical protein